MSELRTIAALAASLTLTALPTSAGPQIDRSYIDRAIVITDKSVVGENGAPVRAAWTFEHLIKEMAGPHEPGPFVLEWLKLFETEQSINTFKVAPRPGIRAMLIAPWKEKEGFTADPATDADWARQAKLSNAPLRLTAITNRLDLARYDIRGKRIRHVKSAGEGRLVFQLLDKDGAPLRMTFIFEYVQRAGTSAELLDWAKRWDALATYTLGSKEHLDALEAITRSFTDFNDRLDMPNNVALGQLRTNELVTEDAKWELREFRLAPSGFLRQETVKVTPDVTWSADPELGKPDLNALLDSFITERVVIDEDLVLPTKWKGKPMLAGSSLAPNPTFTWTAPTAEKERVAFFSLQTCNGCHTGATTPNTVFTHIDARRPERLSEFMLTVDESGALSGDVVGRALHQKKVVATPMPRLMERLNQVDPAAPPAEQIKVRPETTTAAVQQFDLGEYARERQNRVH